MRDEIIGLALLFAFIGCNAICRCLRLFPFRDTALLCNLSRSIILSASFYELLRFQVLGLPVRVCPLLGHGSGFAFVRSRVPSHNTAAYHAQVTKWSQTNG